MSGIRDKKLLVQFGKNLRILRKDKNLSQSYLADLAGIPKSQVARIERGEVNTTVSTIKVLADAMGIDKKQLLDF